MTNKEINIAIGEHCGYKNVVVRSDGTLTGYHQDHRNTLIPNYVNDLNAMHEVEKTISKNAQVDYSYELKEICCPITGEDWEAVHANARQRAEAFLRTIGKWKE